MIRIGRVGGLLVLGALATAALAGCGSGLPGTVPVSGTVTLDGTPVEGAAVLFQPDTPGPAARAVTDASGNFALSTFTGPDGALPGMYKVSVTKMESVPGVVVPPAAPAAPAATESGLPDQSMLSGPGAGPSKAPKSLLPPKYSNPSQSGITAEVKSGMEPVKIELKSS